MSLAWLRDKALVAEQPVVPGQQLMSGNPVILPPTMLTLAVLEGRSPGVSAVEYVRVDRP